MSVIAANKGLQETGKIHSPGKHGVKHVTNAFEIDIRDFHPGKRYRKKT